MAVQPIFDFLTATVLPSVTNTEQTVTRFTKVFSVPAEAMPSNGYPWCTLYEAPNVLNTVDFFATSDGLEELFCIEIVVAVANPTQVRQVVRLPLMRGWRMAIAVALNSHLIADNGSGSLLGGAPGWGQRGGPLLTEKIGPIPWGEDKHWGARYQLFVPNWVISTTHA